MKPIVSQAHFELAVMATVLGTLLAGLVLLVRNYLRARRNLRQVETEMLMRRGFKKAGRLGWVKRVPEDIQ